MAKVSETDIKDPYPMMISLRQGEEVILHDEGIVVAKIILAKTGTQTRIVVLHDKEDIDVDRSKVYLQRFPDKAEES
jgi:antitoxin (DNA-binding transcriptional repressor) of toxin-antitoxin stability system